MAQTPPEETLFDGVTVRELVRQGIRFLGFVRRHIVLALGLGILLGALGGVVAVLLPKTEKAFMDIRLVRDASQNPVAKFESNLVFFASVEQNFRSPALAARTLGEMLGRDPEPAEVDGFLERLTIYPTAPSTYYLEVSHDEAERALALLKKHSELYIESEIDKSLGGVEAEATFLREQVAQVEADLAASEEALQQFRENHADGLPEQAQLHYNALRGLERRKIEVEAKLDQYALELELNREKLSGEKLFVESKVISTQRKQPFLDSIVDLKKELADARASGMTGEHPKVVRLERLIEDYQRLSNSQSAVEQEETEQKRNPIYESIQDTIYQLEVAEAVARKEFEQVSRDLATVREIVQRLPELERRYTSLTRNYEATSDLQTRIFNQLKVVELQIELEKASLNSRYDIITPAQLKHQSIIRGILFLAIGGFIFGVMGGYLLGLLWEIRGILRDFT